jgi:hypothetical protein
MAKCPRCGKSTGLLSNLCDDCKQIIEAEKKAEQERVKLEEAQKEEKEKLELQRVQQEYNAYRNNIISSRVKEFQQRIEQGEKIFLYSKVYIPVDSKVGSETFADDFEIGRLKYFGFYGWDVVAVVPKTLGVGLSNEAIHTAYKTWGGGMGGNVVGVYIILRKEVSSQQPPLSEEYLNRYFNDNLVYFMTEHEIKSLEQLRNKISTG